MSGGSALPDSPRDEVLSPSPTCTAAIPVIDDEPGIASALGHVLLHSGHAVATASNGSLALAKLAEWTFKLILCDLLMPELEGLPLISVHRPPGRDAHANCGRTSVAKRSMAWSKPSIERLGKSQRKFCIPNSW